MINLPSRTSIYDNQLVVTGQVKAQGSLPMMSGAYEGDLGGLGGQCPWGAAVVITIARDVTTRLGRYLLF
jgi:hypothetical protein